MIKIRKYKFKQTIRSTTYYNKYYFLNIPKRVNGNNKKPYLRTRIRMCKSFRTRSYNKIVPTIMIIRYTRLGND